MEHAPYPRADSIGAGAPEITVADFSERALIEAAHEILLVSGFCVSLEDYAAAAVVFLRELARDGLIISRRAIGAHTEDSKDRLLSVENSVLAVLGEERLDGKISK